MSYVFAKLSLNESLPNERKTTVNSIDINDPTCDEMCAFILDNLINFGFHEISIKESIAKFLEDKNYIKNNFPKEDKKSVTSEFIQSISRITNEAYKRKLARNSGF